MFLRVLTTLLAFGALTVGFADAPRPMTFDDLIRVQRISDPQISPDGTQLAVVVGAVDFEANRVNTDIWLVPLGPDGLASGDPKKWTASPKHDRHPRWSPDGKWIAFESNREGEYQIYLLPTTGGEAQRLTSLSTEATQPVWSRDGKSLAFVSSVFPEFSDRPFADADAANRSRLKSRDESKVKARVMTNLLYRHWDSWVDGKRQHVFVVDVTNGVAAGSPRNVTPGPRDGVPASSTFSAGDEFDFAPDGRHLAHTTTPGPVREEAWRTDHEIRAVEIAPDSTDPRSTSLTPDNPAADGLPRYSPDGRWLAYRAQRRAGFEADRWELWRLNLETNERLSLTETFDSSVESFAWSPTGRQILLEAETNGTKALWLVAATGGPVRPLVEGGVNGEATFSADGRWIYCSRSRMRRESI